jgi:hypothetical protein
VSDDLFSGRKRVVRFIPSALHFQSKLPGDDRLIICGQAPMIHDSSRRRHISSSSSSIKASRPNFRSETEWKLTPGGHGLYGMNCPRSQVSTVVDRPTTAKYAKDAERAYYTRQPGSPSPLLCELWARRGKPRPSSKSSVERDAPPEASPVCHNFTSAVEEQTRHPLTEYLSVGPRDDNLHDGLFYELGVRVHQVSQDHPEVWKVSSVS